ncbi:MAG: hypothetical protein JOZ65_22430 [Chloroflexi bacterium]|nr:hypothetical protein [Chloroflexota bacterium]
MGTLGAGHARTVHAAITLFVLLTFGTAVATAQTAQPGIARVGVRVTSDAASSTVEGSLFAIDSTGQAVQDLPADALQARVDGRPVQLSLSGPRPSIAMAAAFWLDSSATPQVRDAVANALAQGIQGVDVNRDTVAILSSGQSLAWDQAPFTNSAADLQERLNQVIQTTPTDDQVSLEQVSNALRALSAQQRDARVLLLFINRPLAGAASINASLGAIRSFAADNAIQVSIVALPGAGGQGPAEGLAEATPGGRVEYVLNATNRQDISRRISLLLAPAFGAHHFQFPAPAEGTHSLSVDAPGVKLQSTTTFQVTTRAVQIDSLETSAGILKADDAVTAPTWVEVIPAANAPIDSVEWTLDGRVTEATTQPWALLIDPEQLGDGRHEVAARIISGGRAGPLLGTSIMVPPDFLRSVRNTVRNWGVIALLMLGEIIVVILFVRTTPSARAAAAVKTTEFPPTLRLNPLAGRYVAPEVIEFPTRGKLRIGYHPPFMDNQVGNRDFARLPYQDVRGDDEAVKDLSRHAACIWRDSKTNDCYIQLGWAGPGERINVRPQTQVFHFGRPQDATSTPFRLSHHDVVRLSTGIEFVFNQVGLRDKPTPESKKLGPFELRSIPGGSGSLRTVAPAQETVAEET